MEYYGQYSGPDLTMVMRASNPDDVSTGELYNKAAKRWVSNPGMLMDAKYTGDWDGITAAEAKAFTG